MIFIIAHNSHVLSESGETLHGGNSSFELLLVDITGSIGINLLESSLDGFLVLLGDLDSVLLLNFLDEADDFFPGDSAGTIFIEDLKDIFPGWWATLLDLGVHLSGFLVESFVGCDSDLEFLLVNITGIISIDHLEHLVDLLDVLLGELVVVLLGDLLKEVE